MVGSLRKARTATLLMVLVTHSGLIFACGEKEDEGDRIWLAVAANDYKSIDEYCREKDAPLDFCVEAREEAYCGFARLAVASDPTRVAEALRAVGNLLSRWPSWPEDLMSLLAVAMIKQGARVDPCGAPGSIAILFDKNGKLSGDALGAILAEGVRSGDTTAILGSLVYDWKRRGEVDGQAALLVRNIIDRQSRDSGEGNDVYDEFGKWLTEVPKSDDSQSMEQLVPVDRKVVRFDCRIDWYSPWLETK